MLRPFRGDMPFKDQLPGLCVEQLYKRFCPPSVDDAGFCPVIRRPPPQQQLCQLGASSNRPPSRLRSSSIRNCTTLVSCTSSSSVLAKPVTRLPFTRGGVARGECACERLVESLSRGQSEYAALLKCR